MSAVDVFIRTFYSGAGTKQAEKDLLAFQANAVKFGRALNYGGIGLGGGLPLGLGVFAGLAVALKVGKNQLETYRAHETALDDLKQAYTSVGKGQSNYNEAIDAYLQKNARYIADVNEIREGYATLTRAGNTQAITQKAIDVALDLSAAKHISFSEAVDRINRALQGNGRGLIELGIHLKDFDIATGAANVKVLDQNGLLTETGAVVLHARDNMDKLEQAQHRLDQAFDRLSTKSGPPLLDTLTNLANAAADLTDDLAGPKGAVGAFGDFLKLVADSPPILKAALGPLADYAALFESIANSSSNVKAIKGPTVGGGHAGVTGPQPPHAAPAVGRPGRIGGGVGI